MRSDADGLDREGCGTAASIAAALKHGNVQNTNEKGMNRLEEEINRGLGVIKDDEGRRTRGGRSRVVSLALTVSRRRKRSLLRLREDRMSI